eukprot:gi/632963298/ref/XP_007897802.1/ PREDICTED: CMRF35-like molecule 5 [Callorhinchus milii]
MTSVSDTLRATQSVTGVVGRAITIDCHYQKQWYRNNKKYWCWGYYRDSCQVVIDTKANNGRRGRFSITDNRDGVFTVTMENLTTGDAGWYNCGIEIPVFDPMFGVELHVSEEMINGPIAPTAGVVAPSVSPLAQLSEAEVKHKLMVKCNSRTKPVSVPVLRFLSAPTASCSGGYVSISCESISGSLPIREKLTYLYIAVAALVLLIVGLVSSYCFYRKMTKVDGY